MNPSIPVFQAAAEAWWTIVWHATWQTALVGGILLSVTYAGRRWPAPLRYGLLLLALLKFAFPPLLPAPIGLFSAYGPAWGAASPSQPRDVLPGPARFAASPGAAAATGFRPQQVGPAETRERLPVRGNRRALGSPHSAAPAPAGAYSWKAWLLLLHLAGVATVILWVGGQFVELRRRRRRAVGAPPAALVEEFHRVAQCLGMARPPQLLLSSEAHSPMATGLFRPAVILPAAVVARASLPEIRVILAHELAHCRRGDLWINWLQLALLAIWWFHPVFWCVHRALRERREDCCDDLLLACGLTTHQAYCEVLIHTAKELSGAWRGKTVLALSGAGQSLAQRVRRIMDGTITRCARLSKPGVISLVVLGGLLLPGLRSQEIKPASADGKPGGPLASQSIGPLATHGEDGDCQAMTQLFAQLRYRGHAGTRSQMKLLEDWLRLGSAPVPFLIRQLEIQSTRPEAVEKRRKAAWLLGQLGPAAQPALPALMRALESPGGVNIAVADALGVLGPVATPAIPALIQALRGEAYSAAFALTRIAPDSPEVARALLDNLADQGQHQRDQTVFALLKMKMDKARLEAVLVGTAEEDPDSRVRSACAAGLHHLGAESPRARQIVAAWRKETSASSALDTHRATVGELIEIVRHPHTPAAETEALMQLQRIGPSAVEAVPVLLAVLDQGEEGYRSSAAMALGAMGPAARAAVPALIHALGSDDRYTYTSAADALGKIGPAARAAVPDLQQALRDPDPRLRLQAAAALWRIDPACTADSVQGLTRLLEHLPPEIEQTWVRIVRTLGEIGPPAQSAVPALRQFLRERQDPRPAEAARALWRIDRGQVEFTVPFLIQAAQDCRADRLLAVQTLGVMGAKAKSALPALQILVKDEDAALQASVEQAIKSLSRATEPP